MARLLTPGTTVLLARPLRWGGRLHPVGSAWTVFRATDHPDALGGPVYLLNPAGGTPVAHGPIANTDDLQEETT